jgi:hypothetical protein
MNSLLDQAKQVTELKRKAAQLKEQRTLYPDDREIRKACRAAEEEAVDAGMDLMDRVEREGLTPEVAVELKKQLAL